MNFIIGADELLTTCGTVKYIVTVNLRHSEIHFDNSKTVTFHRAQSVPVVLCVGPSARLVTGAVVELVVGAGELWTT